MLDPGSLRDSIGNERLREFVGDNSIQEEELVDLFHHRADRLGIGLITGNNLHAGRKLHCLRLANQSPDFYTAFVQIPNNFPAYIARCACNKNLHLNPPGPAETRSVRK
jgi:hypothetical protein